MTTLQITSATKDQPMANNSLQVRVFAPCATLYIANEMQISIGLAFFILSIML